MDRNELIYFLGKAKRRLRRTRLFDMLLFPFGLYSEKTGRAGRNSLLKDRIARHWDSMSGGGRPARTQWWQSLRVKQHRDRLASGKDETLVKAVKRRAGRVLASGVSVGCGAGQKEMALIREGLVERFILFELSRQRIEQGIDLANKYGLSDCVQFRSDDAFSVIPDESVDLVHWNNALHHMLDVDAAISWSRRVLKTGGVFLMDDYVGPSRFRWGRQEMELATRVRQILPDRYLKDPYRPDRSDALIPRKIRRPSLLSMNLTDPSEAAQSDRILEGVVRHFPNAEVIPTGGAVYHLALPEMIHNIDENDEDDRAILDLILLIDELSVYHPGIRTYFATVIAFKD